MKLKLRLVNVFLIENSFSAYLSLLRRGFLARHAKNKKRKQKQKQKKRRSRKLCLCRQAVMLV